MNNIPQKFNVNFQYPVYFIDKLFDQDQNHFQKILTECGIANESKFLFVIDSNVAIKNPTLIPAIQLFFQMHAYDLVCSPLVIPGGEKSKNDFAIVHNILEAVNQYQLDRQGYIVAVGGGAVIDVTGFAAAIAHRGIRHIRIPTTVLSQNDSGIGVKNGINYFNKKNFIGTFAPPFLVINDNTFLNTLSDRDFRCGLAEAIKVSLIKDASFFDFIESNTAKLNARDDETIKKLIFRCAELHLVHIAAGDPFEQGSSRPLDYGHWSAHKLEQLSNFQIMHGEAVIYGMCLDAVYANLSGSLSNEVMTRLLELSIKLKFDIYTPEMELTDGQNNNQIIAGLQEFREHLGGKLTIMMLKKIGLGCDVNEINNDTILASIKFLKEYRK